MASSQRDVRYSFDGKAIRSQTKYVIMNLWDYFEQEAQKAGRVVNVTAKVSKATGKGYSLLTEIACYTCAFVQASWNERSVGFVPSIEKRVFFQHQKRGMLARVFTRMQTTLTEMPYDKRFIRYTRTRKI